jgi:hypothetical protein
MEALWCIVYDTSSAGKPKYKSFRWVQNILQITMLQCISHLDIAVLHLQGCLLERRVARWGWRLVGVVWWVASRNIRQYEYFAGESKTSTKTHWSKQYLTPILLLHANIKEVRGLGNVAEAGCGRCSSHCCEAVVMSMRKPVMVSDKYDH